MDAETCVQDAWFTEMVIDQHQQLRGFIRALGIEPDWVDDLAQEVFLVAWREREILDPERDVARWLRGIARNLARNELRKDHRRKRILHEGLADLLIRSVDDDAESPLWKRHQMSILRDCIEQLAPKSREIVAVRYGGGWKAPEVADHLGMTAVAIRQALMRIRSQLKKCLGLRMAER